MYLVTWLQKKKKRESDAACDFLMTKKLNCNLFVHFKFLLELINL